MPKLCCRWGFALFSHLFLMLLWSNFLSSNAGGAQLTSGKYAANPFSPEQAAAATLTLFVPTQIPSATATQTRFATATALPSVTATIFIRPLPTATPTVTPHASATPIAQPTDTATTTSTPTAVATWTSTATLPATQPTAPTATVTDQPTVTASATPSITATVTDQPTATATLLPTVTPTGTPSLSPTAPGPATPTVTATKRVGATPRPTATPLPTNPPKPTATPKPTNSPGPSATPKPTATLLHHAGSTLGDFVWSDDNGNGLVDLGEKGSAAIQVNLYTGVGSLLATTRTDEQGLYLFAVLPSGDYRLEFVAPPAAEADTRYVLSSPAGTVALPAGASWRTPVITLDGVAQALQWDVGLTLLVGDTFDHRRNLARTIYLPYIVR